MFNNFFFWLIVLPTIITGTGLLFLRYMVEKQQAARVLVTVPVQTREPNQHAF